MYDPVKDGVEKGISSVRYREMNPPSELSDLVHCFWELKTDTDLADDFCLHVLPDACVNILFNQLDPRIAGVTALYTTYTELNLGKSFYYVGVQFFPGVWQGDSKETVGSYVGEPYRGVLPLIETNRRLAELDFTAKQSVLSSLVEQLAGQNLVVANPVTSKILASIDQIYSVDDMAKIVNMSTRQLQRTLKKATGFSPHDFLKVIRLQQTFKRDYLVSFADQSHFIHSFRNITGYTPSSFFEKFDV